MKTIHKFQLPPVDAGKPMSLFTHKGAVILTIQKQNDVWTVWLLLDDREEWTWRRIARMGTGWGFAHDVPVPPYIATVQDGPFVWHFFDLGEHKSEAEAE